MTIITKMKVSPELGVVVLCFCHLWFSNNTKILHTHTYALLSCKKEGNKPSLAHHLLAAIEQELPEPVCLLLEVANGGNEAV